MQNKFMQSKFYQNVKENRAVYVTVVTLLVALAVIISVTAVANRSKKPPVDTEAPVTDAVPETNAPDTGVETQPQGSTDVMDHLPTFSLPVSGTLIKSHDATTQVFSDTMKDYRVHLGVDIATQLNEPVTASADGTVMQVWEDAMMGVCVAIKHDGDACSIYKNLAATLPDGVAEGKNVKAGETIGYVGESAMVEIAEEPHLHFEMTVGGLAVDPLEHFEEDAVATLSQDANYEDATN